MRFRRLVEVITEMEVKDKTTLRGEVARVEKLIEDSLRLRKITRNEHDLLYEVMAKTTRWYL